MAAMGKSIAGAFLVAAAVAAAVLPVPAAWVEEWFARVWFPPVQRLLTSASNVVTFALFDVLVLAAAGVVVAAVVSVLRAPRGRRLATLGRRTWQGTVLLALAYLVFLATWGANYRRQPMTATLDFDDGRVTTAAVTALNTEALGELARLRPRLPKLTGEWPDADRVAADLGLALESGTSLLGLPGPVRAGRPKYRCWMSTSHGPA